MPSCGDFCKTFDAVLHVLFDMYSDFLYVCYLLHIFCVYGEG